MIRVWTRRGREGEGRFKENLMLWILGRTVRLLVCKRQEGRDTSMGLKWLHDRAQNHQTTAQRQSRGYGLWKQIILDEGRFLAEHDG